MRRLWLGVLPLAALLAHGPGFLQRPNTVAVSFERAQGPRRDDKPLLLFLPGIDGSSRSESRQLRRLGQFFDCWSLALGPEDRSNLDELLSKVETFVEERRMGRPVLLVAESMGSVLALNLALRSPQLAQALCLINPATSYRRSLVSLVTPLLQNLPEEMYRNLPAVLTPLVGRLGWHEGIIGRASTDQLDPVANLLRVSRGLHRVLPPETLRFREAMLRQGLRRAEPQLQKLQSFPRTLLLAGTADLVLPSVSETERLQQLLPGAQRAELEGVAHAAFDDPDNVNVLGLLHEFGLVQELTGVRSKTPALKPTTFLSRSLAQARSWVSPVFLSTHKGRITSGLPEVDGPLLLVGNHQLFSLDGIFIVEEFLREQQRLVTALVYPPLLDDVSPLDPLPYPFPGSRELFEKFKVQPVSARNLLRSLAGDGAALLFPGGAREVFKRKGEEYQLFWPEQSDLVRLAARANATIVPFSGVGSDEFFGGSVLDSDELLRMPLLGDWLRQRISDLPSFVKDDVFVPPVPVPRLQGPRRNYFLFGEPVPTATLDHRDRASCAKAYKHLRQSVEDGIQYLLHARKEDPFEEMAARYALEQATGVSAPSFSLSKQDS